MELNEALKKYLEEEAERDPLFRAKFDAEKIGKCAEYVTAEAKKHLSGKSGAVEDMLVFKWARDFFNDGLAEKSEPKHEQDSGAEISETAEREEKTGGAEPNTDKPKKGKKKQEEEADSLQLTFDFGEM